MESLSEADRRDYEDGYAKVKQFIADLSSAGGLILAATDTGDDRMPGVTMYRELQLLVDAGVPPYRALLGATRWPAQLLRKRNLIGTIETGKQADIVLLAANPLDDIAAVKDVNYVIYNGSVVKTPAVH
jgi:imidazolonepropionase-like amidohydrolase